MTGSTSAARAPFGSWPLLAAAFALAAAARAEAACTVNGVVGAPIGNDAQIVCSGSNVTPIVSSATGVSLTLTPGATIAVPGSRAIQLGDNAYVDLQAGSVVSGAPTTQAALVTVGDNSIVSVSGSIVRAGGVDNLVDAGVDSIVAVAGSIGGAIRGIRSQAFIYSGASIGFASRIRSLSNAGSVSSAELMPINTDQELYNEGGGQIPGGVSYGGLGQAPVGSVPAMFDSIIVNRSTMGSAAALGGQYSVVPGFALGNLQFTNEPGATTLGGVAVTRGYRPSGSSGTNRGTIQGPVWLLAYMAEGFEGVSAPWGTDQRFENFGSVAGVEVHSGRFVQHATGSFATGATLRSLTLRNIDQVSFLGHVEISGNQTVACLLGGEDLSPASPGGVVELRPGAVLTLQPASAQACGFNGTVIGGGRLLKDGAGTQRLGATDYPPGWVVSRPPTDYSGGTDIRAGTLAVARSDALGTGTVQFNGDGARWLAEASGLLVSNPLQFTQTAILDTGPHAVELTGPSSGAATVRKLGSGLLAWTGSRGHAGQTLVEAGTLRLSGPLAGPLRVQSGAVLEGQATMAAALTLDAGSRLRARIGATPFAAALVTLGGELELLEPTTLPPIGVPTILLGVAGTAAASGTFAGLPQGARIEVAGHRYRVDYLGGDGNDVSLTRIGPLLAPSNVIATPGDARITLAFDPPPPNGEPVSGYRASCAPGDIKVEGAGSPLVVTGLVNGTPYSCGLVALGVDGPGAAATVGATPRTVPGAPRNPVGAGPAGTLEVAFQPPLSDGGAPVQSYTLSCQSTATWQVSGTASPLAILGVPDGVLYSCSVVATNAAGSGPASTAVEIMPGVVPTAVRELIVVDGDGASGIDFLAPTIGAPILDYRAACQPGGATVTAAAPPLVVTGLDNGTAYACEVTARNAVGRGAAQQATLRPTSVLFADGFE